MSVYNNTTYKHLSKSKFIIVQNYNLIFSIQYSLIIFHSSNNSTNAISIIIKNMKHKYDY